MASVNELIALAEHENRANNPGASALQSFLTGFQTSQTNSLDRAIKLIQLDEARRKAEYQQQQNQLIQDFVGQRENTVQNSVSGIGGDKTSVTPTQKLQKSVSFGPDGAKMDVKVIEPKAPDPVNSFEEALAEQYRSGKITLQQFGEMKSKSQGVSPSLQYQIDKDAALKAQGKDLPANTVLAVNEGKSVARMLPEVEKAIAFNRGDFGPITGPLADLNPYAKDAKAFDAQMRAASQSFGRFMEGGVLRKEDEVKYLKMFPQKNDPDGTKLDKLAIVKKMLAEKFESDRKALRDSGFNTQGLGELEIPDSIFEEKGTKTAEKRYDELIESGMKEDDVYQILKKEGY